MSTSRLLAVLALAGATACGATLKAPAAPGGAVTTGHRVRVELADLWVERDLVVVFFRGHW